MHKDGSHLTTARLGDVFDTISSQALSADKDAKVKQEPWKQLGLEPGKEIHPAIWNLPENKQVDVITRMGTTDSYGTSGNGSH